MFAGAFAGRMVLITGNTGFKGSWLSIWLQRLGANVVGYALEPPTDPSIFVGASLAERITHVHGDIRDTGKLSSVLAEHRPEFVFHLAAAPLVRASYSAPVETFSVNLMGTLSLLEAIRTLPHRCQVVAVSSDKCYENREWGYGYREIDELGGHDPYSASKASMEIALHSFQRSYFAASRENEHGVRVASGRAGNVIGGGDWSADRIIPDAVRAASRGEVLGVRSPESVRSWQHVLEPLSGYLWLAARMSGRAGASVASPFNFGPLPTASYTVAQLADAFTSLWKGASWRRVQTPAAEHEAGQLLVSIDKARSQLGWLPTWDFQTTLRRTVDWYRAWFEDRERPEAVLASCLADIEQYERDALAGDRVWAAATSVDR